MSGYEKSHNKHHMFLQLLLTNEVALNLLTIMMENTIFQYSMIYGFIRVQRSHIRFPSSTLKSYQNMHTSQLQELTYRYILWKRRIADISRFESVQYISVGNLSWKKYQLLIQTAVATQSAAILYSTRLMLMRESCEICVEVLTIKIPFHKSLKRNLECDSVAVQPLLACNLYVKH